MCTYKSAALFHQRFARKPNRNGEDPLAALENRYDIAGYLDYQGGKLVERFDANTYLVISKAMDTFDLAHGYASEEQALERIRAKVLLVGSRPTGCFPAADVQALAARLRTAGVRQSVSRVRFRARTRWLPRRHPLLAPLLSAALWQPRTLSHGGRYGVPP